MARSAADLALELQVLAGPDEEWDGIGYKLALQPPRHDKIGDYRVLVLDKHPLCPTADPVRTAVDALADRLGDQGCTVLRGHPDPPDLARTTYHWVNCWRRVGHRPGHRRGCGEAAAAALSPDNLSITAALVAWW